jgi:23S rRNA pseudouridine1911/1915/1917 synthase
MKSAPVLTVSRAGHDVKLLDFLAAERACSLRKAKALLDERCVFVNGHRIWMAKHRLQAGDRIEIHATADRKDKAPGRLCILFENEFYMVADKPPGLLANGSGSLETLVQRDPAYHTCRAAHRLDRDTSGCLCFARSQTAFDTLVQAFKDDRVTKRYEALVHGSPRQREGTITIPIDGQRAVTHWRMRSAGANAAHLQLKIDTGRTHQIRKHLASIGHPLVGDRQYGTSRPTDIAGRRAPRQMLHASVFEAPLGDHDQIIRVASPLPADFRQTRKTLGIR